jgi:hypothetical protein
MRWVSGWQDFGHLNVTQGSFTVYLAVVCQQKVELTIGMETEKKLKQKTVVFSPTPAGQGVKQRRLSFGGSGRRFRFIVQSTGATPWQLHGGVQIEAETDTD